MTIKGTIIAPNYAGFLILYAKSNEPWFCCQDAAQNTTPSGLTDYYQYDGEGKYDRRVYNDEGKYDRRVIGRVGNSTLITKC